MRIAAVSVAPLLPDVVIGGSQKILVDVLTGLARNGHDVQVWCTGTSAHSGEFEISGVRVHPEMKLRGSFPATHKVPPFKLAATTQALSEMADWGDRVYLHADAVYLRHALGETDIVRSIHDYFYEEALVSTLAFDATATIVPSNYLKSCIEATAAITGKESIESVCTIPNGVEVHAELPEPKLPDGIAPRSKDDLILLFPHRPEPTKGLVEAFRTAVEVQLRESSRNVRLLLPMYPKGSGFDEAASESDEVQQLAAEHDAESIVELHEWLSPSEMPSYLAAGDVTLCIGSFIESFGLVPMESVANGTPVVCSRVGALREFADIAGVTLTPYGDMSSAADAVLSAASGEADQLEAGRTLIRETFSPQAMVEGYERVISRRLSERRDISVNEDNQLQLAPWTDVQGDRIFNDYTSESARYPKVVTALQSTSNINGNMLLISASLDAEILHARENGILIPKFEISPA